MDGKRIKRKGKIPNDVQDTDEDENDVISNSSVEECSDHDIAESKAARAKKKKVVGKVKPARKYNRTAKLTSGQNVSPNERTSDGRISVVVMEERIESAMDNLVAEKIKANSLLPTDMETMKKVIEPLQLTESVAYEFTTRIQTLIKNHKTDLEVRTEVNNLVNRPNQVGKEIASAKLN